MEVGEDSEEKDALILPSLSTVVILKAEVRESDLHEYLPKQGPSLCGIHISAPLEGSYHYSLYAMI